MKMMKKETGKRKKLMMMKSDCIIDSITCESQSNSPKNINNPLIQII